MRAAAVDTLFVDTTIRSGQARDHVAVRPPYVPGADLEPGAWVP